MQCTADLDGPPRAYADYQAAWAEGDDGRPDWVARKTCNYLTGSIDVRGMLNFAIVSQQKLEGGLTGVWEWVDGRRLLQRGGGQQDEGPTGWQSCRKCKIHQNENSESR